MGEDPRVGTTLLGGLRVNRVLGAGGMGVVYEVEHPISKQRRALKVLRPERSDDGKAIARLMREASIASRVQHPRLVETYGVGRLEDGAPYLLMERLDGRSLAERLDAEGTLPPSEAVRIGAEVAEGLAAAHAVGVLHRDLTPKNVFLVRAGDAEHVRLVDFGLSKMVAGRTDRFGHLTDTGAFVGTPYYVSPEQASGGIVDARADQYSLAVILYECVAGRPPFVGDSLIEVLGKIASGEHAPLATVRPDVGVGVSRAISRALSRRPEDRFPDVTAFVEALSFEYGATAPIAVPRPAVTDPAPTPRPRPADPAPAPRPVAAPRRMERTPRAAVSAPPARRSWRGMAAAVAVVGLLALGVTFGATSYVLRARRANVADAQPPAPVPAPPMTHDQSLEHLRGLYDRGDYRRCVRDGEQARRSIAVLLVVLDCAEQGMSMRAAHRACQELNARAPTHPRAASCRERLNDRAHQRHSRRL